MNSEAKALYLEVKKLHERVTPLVNSMIVDTIESGEAYQCMDTVYALREAVTLLDDLKRSMNKASKLVTNIAVRLAPDKNIRSSYCTAVCKAKAWPKYPSKRAVNEALHDTIFSDLGIPPYVGEMDIVRLHGPGFSEYCTKLLALGKPLPGNISLKQTTLEPVLHIRKKLEPDKELSKLA
jgi:hypothetical protein